MRPGDQGYFTGTVIFADDSKLHFRAYNGAQYTL
jgi:hypothetical protein